MTPSIPAALPAVPARDTLSDRLSAMTHDLLAAAGADRHLRWTNPAWEALLGWTPEDLSGRSYHELIHPDDRARIQAFEAEVLADTAGERPEAELRLRATDGTYRWFVFSTSYSPADELVYFCGKDITARRRMVEALTVSEARYRGLIAHLPDSTVHVFDHDLRLVLSEGERLRDHGYEPEALEGRLLRDVLPPAAYARLAPEYRAALAGEHRSFDHETDDGTATYWVRIAPLRDDRGRTIGGMALARDITARRASERALEERACELERSNAELEQFAYIASHDLSEPLRMVSSYLQLLRRRYRGRLDPDADEFIDFAVDGATRMRNLIDDLLTYSRAGRGDAPLATVDSRAVAERVAEEVRGAAEARGARIHIGDLPLVRGDEQQLGQLFQNLIGNGVKFVAADRTPEVDVTAVRDGERWRFTVSDNGIGLEPGHVERIFRMFQRLHTRDSYPGTGIGLAIAKKVVERHHGSIWVEARPAGGTGFCFTLPRAEDAP